MKPVQLLAATMCLAATSAATSARAQGYFFDRSGDLAPYVGLNVGILRYNESEIGTFTPSVVFARAGLPVTRYLGLEVRLGTGLANYQNSGYEVGAGTLAGAYVKGSVPLASNLSVYGVAGVGRIRLVRNFANNGTTNTRFSFGIGGDLDLTRQMLVNFEWTRYPTGTEFGMSYSSDLFSAGVAWRF